MINRRHHTSSIYMRWLVPSLAEKEGGNHSFIRKGKKRGLRQISEKKNPKVSEYIEADDETIVTEVIGMTDRERRNGICVDFYTIETKIFPISVPEQCSQHRGVPRSRWLWMKQAVDNASCTLWCGASHLYTRQRIQINFEEPFSPHWFKNTQWLYRICSLGWKRKANKLSIRLVFKDFFFRIKQQKGY